jgi:hypothetical protein
MTQNMHPDLRTVAEAVRITAPDRYVLDGNERHITGSAGPSADAETTVRAVLLRAIENELYYRYYRRPGAPHLSDPATASIDTMRSFTAALSAANRGTGTWDPGWQIQEKAPDGRVLVRKDEVTYRAAQADVQRMAGEGDDPTWPAGMRVRVRVPKEIRQLVQGFYMALGDAAWPDSFDRHGRLVRLYWGLSSDAAPDYLRQITGALNRLGLPFRTKVVQDPSQYRNADAGVLYVPPDVIDAAWPAIAETYATLRHRLRSVVPMFTRTLADGLGLAEDPGGGISFGQSRCRLVAHGLWSAFEAGAHDAAGCRHHIAAAFAANDIDPAHPHRTGRARFAEPTFTLSRAPASGAMMLEPQGL